MNGKRYRMSRIFDPDERTVVLPVDHGMAFGVVSGLEQPHAVMVRLVAEGPDAVLINDGLNRVSDAALGGRQAPARILALDALSVVGNQVAYGVVNSVETAVRQGYDGVKMLMIMDQTASEKMTNIEAVAKVIQDAQSWEMPVMVEPIVWQPRWEADQRDKQLADGARIAYELGADIVKMGYPSRPERLRQWAAWFTPIPLVLYGGPLQGSGADVIRWVQDAIESGAKGVVIGRNVWQRPDQEAAEILRHIIRVVHPARDGKPTECGGDPA
jgi:DhnA family fructose-bisphosphate aldolase class Ia